MQKGEHASKQADFQARERATKGKSKPVCVSKKTITAKSNGYESYYSQEGSKQASKQAEQTGTNEQTSKLK